MNRFNMERELIVRLFQVSNALQTFMDKELKEHNVTTKQFFMMIILGTFDYDPKLSEVSERFGTSRQNAKQVLLKLEKSEYVQLYKDEQDSRILRVTLTRLAKEFWSQRNNDETTIKEIFKEIETKSIETFVSCLRSTAIQISEMSKGK